MAPLAAPLLKLPAPPPRFVDASCPDENAFRFRDGASARSLRELASRLRAPGASELVAFHREHFAPWIREVVGDAPLAARVQELAGSGAVADALQDAVRGLCEQRAAELNVRS